MWTTPPWLMDIKDPVSISHLTITLTRTLLVWFLQGISPFGCQFVLYRGWKAPFGQFPKKSGVGDCEYPDIRWETEQNYWPVDVKASMPSMIIGVCKQKVSWDSTEPKETHPLLLWCCSLPLMMMMKTHLFHVRGCRSKNGRLPWCTGTLSLRPVPLTQIEVLWIYYWVTKRLGRLLEFQAI